MTVATPGMQATARLAHQSLALPRATALTCGLLCALLAGCQDDEVRPLNPAPGPPQWPTVVHDSPRLTSVPSDTVGPNGKVARVRCVTCHAQVETGTFPETPADLKEFHQGLRFDHGELSCSSCHEPGQPTLLRLASGETIPTRDALRLCAQCHGPKKESYDHGTHGGMTGHWDLSRGPRVRNHCVDCHDAHVPAIPQVLPVMPPVDRGKFAGGEARGNGALERQRTAVEAGEHR